MKTSPANRRAQSIAPWIRRPAWREPVYQLRRVVSALSRRLAESDVHAAYGCSCLLHSTQLLELVDDDQGRCPRRAMSEQGGDSLGRGQRLARWRVERLTEPRERLVAGPQLTNDERPEAVERQPGGGIGLLNMRERMEALGGRLFLRSGLSGTEVEAFLPNETLREGEAGAA